MLVIEGPDGSGKSTLVKALAEALEWPINERVVAQDTTIAGGRTQLRTWVEDNVNRGFQRRVFDRHRLISEPIYGPLCRNELQDGFDDMEWFAEAWTQFLHCRPFVIYCLPHLEVVTHNVINDPANKEVSPLIAQVYWQYWALAARSGHPSYLHDYTNPQYGVPQLARFITRHAERMLK